jgi:hypothetical protein
VSGGRSVRARFSTHRHVDRVDVDLTVPLTEPELVQSLAYLARQLDGRVHKLLRRGLVALHQAPGERDRMRARDGSSHRRSESAAAGATASGRAFSRADKRKRTRTWRRLCSCSFQSSACAHLRKRSQRGSSGSSSEKGAPRDDEVEGIGREKVVEGDRGASGCEERKS